MVFISSTVGLRSAFVAKGLPTPAVCQNRRPAAPKMELKDMVASGAKVLLVVGAVTLGAVSAFPSNSQASLFSFPGQRPKNIGLRYERYLDNCPPTPNCVSSMANVYDSHFVPAWTYNASGPKKSMSEGVKDITKVIEDYPRTTIIESRPTKSEVGEGYYIYAEFQSKLLGFVDDVEIFFQPDNTTVEYRSASRLGEGDFDANRKRIRDLRVALQEMDKRWASVGY